MPAFFPGPASQWPQQRLNKPGVAGLDSRTNRIAGRAAPATYAWDANGYLKTLGTDTTPFIVTIDGPAIDAGVATIGAPYTTADVPPRSPARDQTGSQKCIGKNLDGTWYIEDLDMYGGITVTGGASTLAADFNPGDTVIHLVSGASFPASGAAGTVRLGSSAGESAGATLDGLLYKAMLPGVAGQAIRVTHVTGGALAVSRVGNDITITYVPGATSRGNVKTALDGATGPGQAGEIITCPTGGATKLNVDVGFTNLTGGDDPGVGWSAYTTKATNDLTGATGPSRTFRAGSRVRWEPTVYVTNVRESDPQVYGFDDSMEAALAGSGNLNSLPGMATASLVLGAITYTASPGEIGNARTIQYVDPHAASQALNIYQATLTTPFADPNANVVMCNKADGGTHITVVFVVNAGTNPLTVTTNGSAITVQLATTAGVSTTTASQLVTALNTDGKVQAFLAGGSNGSGTVLAMSKRHLVEAEFVIQLATNASSVITSTATNVVALVNGDGRTTDYITAAGSGAVALTEVARTALSGGVGGTLNVRNATAAMPNPSGGRVRAYARVGKWGISYTSYTDDGGGNGHFSGVSPGVNVAAGGYAQPVTDGDPIKPLFPYGELTNTGSPAQLAADACKLVMRNVWGRYATSEPGWSLSGDQHDVDKFFYEGFIQDGLKWGGNGGVVGLRLGSLTGGGGTVMAHPCVPHGHNAITHFDNFQVYYSQDTILSNIYVVVARNSIMFSSGGGAGDYPANEMRSFTWRRCVFDGSDSSSPTYGIVFAGGKSATALPADSNGINECWFNKTQFLGSTGGGIDISNGRQSNNINLDSYYDDGTPLSGTTVSPFSTNSRRWLQRRTGF